MRSSLLKYTIFSILLGVFPCLIVAQTLDVTILATSDLHNNYMDYDYFIDKSMDRTGLVRVASAIKQQRRENPNVLLFDNGDNIQGNPFGDYLVKKSFLFETSPIMQIMNNLNYDAMTLGNHEFNFGLEYLHSVIRGARFPVVCANVVKPGTEQPYFRPYTILKRKFIDSDGVIQDVKIGVIGLVPPQILVWDGMHLNGKAEVLDAYETAEKYVPEVKRQGADIIILLSHSGISDSPRKGKDENFSWYLTSIPEVDAVISGHSHNQFPSQGYAQLQGVDISSGTVNGVPVVMPGYFGDNLGIIKIVFERSGDRWERATGTGFLVPVYDSVTNQSLPPVQSVADVLKPTHEAVLAYIRSPVGAIEDGANAGSRLTGTLNSFYALVHDDYSVQLVNEAQMWYAKKVLENTEYSSLPILSAAAPFKCGGRQGPNYFTNVPAGPLAIKNMADIYVYSNTVVILKMTGAEIQEWLERSAGQFRQIKGDVSEVQELINWAQPTYLFDVIDGITYEIDVSQPARYNDSGSLGYPEAHRIINVQFNGLPIEADQEFAIVTNNYRAYGGGDFPGISSEKIIYVSPDENRYAILQYIEEKQEITPISDGNWRLVFPSNAENIIFISSPLAKEALIPGVIFESLNEEGFGVYKIDPDSLK
ncbi:MAG: bifunctional 2',3'-cyclic-nucleotide 2'-phosphodiesterase/3'-nucleotidase [Treponema sp.]|jgi:2',3'-cyclic-nucleotide 2'-phosphodiesterase/3'-nucleotidase|nr:bifunctional 2',3'-cyclic-nucleotide 2'-phosphodiesterase/3'-nucleotidase [Treponema sp.]